MDAREFALMKDTNNLLTLFTKLYSDSEVLKKVVVVKADRYSWWVCFCLPSASSQQARVPVGGVAWNRLYHPFARTWISREAKGERDGHLKQGE